MRFLPSGRIPDGIISERSAASRTPMLQFVIQVGLLRRRFGGSHKGHFRIRQLAGTDDTLFAAL